MKANVELAKRFVIRLAKEMSREHSPCKVGADRALEHAIMTAPEKRDPALLGKLDAIMGRVIAAG